MPVFSLRSFFEPGAGPSPVPAELGGVTFLLRPLDGIECEEYRELSGQLGRAVFLLSRGLLDGESGGAVGPAGARRLFARHQPLALELARRVIRLTESRWRAESARWTETRTGPEAETLISQKRFFNQMKQYAQPRR